MWGHANNVLDFENEHYLEPSTVINIATECANRNHSAVFPIELPSWFIKLFTRKNNIVLDPFSGVGTTGIAALLLGRNYICIEESENFVDEAIKNIAGITNVINTKRKIKNKVPLL